MPEIRLRNEQAGDADTIRAINRQAFGGDAEPQLVDDLRAEGYSRLSLVAVDGEMVIGHVLFSALPIDGPRGVIDALALAPLAVAPAYQKQGVGSALVREGLKQAAEQGYPAVVVLGEPEYYGRFGFRPELAASIESPYSGPYLMGIELQPGALDSADGKAYYPPPFARLE
jgi:putative acetyltransferase